MNQYQQFLEILDSEAVKPDDLEIITLAHFKQPGLAKLVKATVGEPNPLAPNSRPLFSRTGARIGFVAAADLIEGPYTMTYWIQENGERGDNNGSVPAG